MAEGAASNWLKLVDSGNYAQSWDNTGTVLKANVARDQWQELLLRNRRPVGRADLQEADIGGVHNRASQELLMDSMSFFSMRAASSTRTLQSKPSLPCWTKMENGECACTPSDR